MISPVLASRNVFIDYISVLFLAVVVCGLEIPELPTSSKAALQDLQYNRVPILPRSPRGPVIGETVGANPYAIDLTTTGSAALNAATSNPFAPDPTTAAVASQSSAVSSNIKSDATVKDISNNLWPGSSCDNLKGVFLSKDMWDQTQTTQQFQNWTINNSHNTDATNNFATEFALPLGIAQSFVCGIPQGCERPDCGAVENADKPGTAWTYEVVVSLANISKYLNAVWAGINLGKEDFNGLQTTVQQTFYPANNDNPIPVKEALSAVGTALILAGVLAGGPTAGIITIGIAGGIGNGITAIPSQEQTFANLAADEGLATNFTRSIQGFLDYTNTEIFSSGPFSSDTSIHVLSMLSHGAWQDYRNIPVLNSDKSLPMVSATDLRNYYYSLILAAVVNGAWKAQYTYIMCFPMNQTEFDNLKVSAGNNDGRLKLFYQDSGCYLQSIAKTNSAGVGLWKTANPSGWGQMNGKDFPFLPSDVIKASVDADNFNGYSNGPNLNWTEISTIVGLSQPTSPQNLVYDWPYLWNIPICRLPPDVEQQTTLKQFASYLNGPGVSTDGDFSLCHCFDRVDKNGQNISTVFDLTPFATDGMGLCGPGVSVGIGPYFPPPSQAAKP